MKQHPERSWRGLLPPTGEPAAARNGNTTAPLLIDLNQPAPGELILAMILCMGSIYYSTTAFFGCFMVWFSLLLMRRLYE